ncbi:hypothetical protein Tco_1285524 [Tanacetum coccineum]
MASKEAKSTTRKIVTNDQADYYSGITSIMINGKNAYELKGKFLDDLHKNDFSGTHGEDAVEHIEYFLKLLTQSIYPMLIKINSELLSFQFHWLEMRGDCLMELKDQLLANDENEPTNEETADLEETNHDDEQEIDEILRIETNLFDYETPLCEKFKEFNYLLKWPTCSWKEDGYCNRGNLPGAYIVGNTLHYQDLKWYDTLKDYKMKEEALRNKVVMEGLINDDNESSNNGWRRWDGYEIIDHDQEEI